MSYGNFKPFLSYARFRFLLQVKTTMILPPYKGAVFRGAFGNALKRLVCSGRGASCNSCLHQQECVYIALFEPKPPPDFRDTGKFSQSPRPYVLNPPLTIKQLFRPGETLAFDLVLIGFAIEAFPYFIQLFQDQGRGGLGRERDRYTLAQVHQIRNETLQLIFDGETNTLFHWETEQGPIWSHLGDRVNAITLEFLSPLRLKVRGDLVTKLTFSLLWERLVERLTILAALYGEIAADMDSQATASPWSIGLKGLSAQASNVSTQADNLHWYDWERYSRRQKGVMKLGGLVGTITCTGPLTTFLPFLQLGAVVNLGQGTTFGLG